jgi:hypothetical protein
MFPINGRMALSVAVPPLASRRYLHLLNLQYTVYYNCVFARQSHQVGKPAHAAASLLREINQDVVHLPENSCKLCYQ